MSWWLRPNKYANFAGNLTQIWDTPLTRKMRPGDKYILYITKGPNEYFIVGVFEYMGNLRCRAIHYLPENLWIPRPLVAEWRVMLRDSLDTFTNFNIEGHGWVGRIASEGLQLTEKDFNNLKDVLLGIPQG